MDQPAGLQHAEGIAHGDPGHAEPLRELALGLETIAGPQVAVEDRPLDLRDDLPGGPGLPDGGERHAAHAVAAAFCLPATASAKYATLS